MDSFTYLGSTVPSKASLDVEISSRIAKAAGVMAKLNKRVWNNDLLSERTKLQVYRACVPSTLYGSKSWPNMPTCRASLYYSSKDAFVGSVMFTVWNPIACQGKSSTGNCGRAPDAWADHSFALRMFASVTCVSLISIPIPGRSSRKTETPGVTVLRRGHSGPRRRPGPRPQSSRRRERNDKYQFERPPTTSLPAATKTAS